MVSALAGRVDGWLWKSCCAGQLRQHNRQQGGCKLHFFLPLACNARHSNTLSCENAVTWPHPALPSVNGAACYPPQPTQLACPARQLLTPTTAHPTRTSACRTRRICSSILSPPNSTATTCSVHALQAIQCAIQLVHTAQDSAHAHPLAAPPRH